MRKEAFVRCYLPLVRSEQQNIGTRLYWFAISTFCYLSFPPTKTTSQKKSRKNIYVPNSSCTICAGGSSPSARFRFRAYRVPDPTPFRRRRSSNWVSSCLLKRRTKVCCIALLDTYICHRRLLRQRTAQELALYVNLRVFLQIHGDGLVNLLPQVRAKDLNQRDLQRWDLRSRQTSHDPQMHNKQAKTKSIIEC